MNKIIKLLSQFGISIEYRVMNPSRNPAEIVKGKVLRNILKLFLKPTLKELTLEYVLGKRIEAPKINPATASITIAKISMEP